MVFDAVKKSIENVCISLTTYSKHQHLKINKFLKTEYKVIYLKITKAATGCVLWKKGVLKNFANF